jgi:hypothetical protein
MNSGAGNPKKNAKKPALFRAGVSRLAWFYLRCLLARMLCVLVK